MIERTGVDTDQDIVVAKMGLVDVGIVEDAGVAVLVEEDGFHGKAPGSDDKPERGARRYIVARYVGRWEFRTF